MEIREKLERHLTVLCEEIGARPTGSQKNRDAAAYACEELQGYGFDVQRQEFDCIDWENHGGALTVNGQTAAVVPAPYSLACDVRGEVVLAGSLEQLRGLQIAGKIVVLHGDLAMEPLMPKNFTFWNPDEHKEIISLLERGPLAVLTVSLSQDRYIPVIEDGDFETPCGIILPEVLSLLQGSSALAGAAAVLTLDAARRPSKGANILASYGSGGKKVCLSAHIDTKLEAPGALDNASGTAVLLALASELAGKEFPYCIEMVLFNGETYFSTPGEMAYLASHLSSPSEYLCALNVDGAGLKGHKTAYSFYGFPEKLAQTVVSIAGKMGGFEEVEPWPQGDQTLFACSGVPAAAFTSGGIFELVEEVLNTERDTLERVDAGILEELVQFLVDVLQTIK